MADSLLFPDRGFSINGRYCEGNQSFADDKVRYCVNRKRGCPKSRIAPFAIVYFGKKNYLTVAKKQTL
jgi:hypothetical protein